MLSVTLRSSQIVSGLSLTIFGIGLATGKSIEGRPLAGDFRPVRWGVLADIAVIEAMLFNHDPIGVLVVWESRNLRRRIGPPAALGLAYTRDER